MENINFTLQWFIFLKIAIAALTVYVIIKAVYSKGKVQKVYIVVSLVLLLLALIAPVKMSVNTKDAHKQQANVIQQRELPPKVSDDSFNEKFKELNGISKEDLK